MTNYSHGHEAEQYAAKWLKKQGYKIHEINWRRPRAEIDVIAQKKRGPIIFVEVKYRETDSHGTGFDYITDRKLEQMRFAAELWVSEQNYMGEYVLGAIELGGPNYTITSFVDEIT